MSASPPGGPAPRVPAARAGWGFRLVAGLTVMVLRLLRWRIRTEGLDNVPREGGVVVVWNHHGHLDLAPAMWETWRRLRRPVRVLAKRELWDAGVAGRVVRAMGAIPVERHSEAGRARSLEAAVAALRRGELVAVAPEGTLSRSFELLPFRSGAVRMAAAAGVPVVPIVSWGSHRAVSADRPFSLRRAWRLPVEVRIGPPEHPGPDDDPAEVSARLRARMAAELDALQRGYPDGRPAGAWWVPARLGGGAPPLKDAPPGEESG